MNDHLYTFLESWCHQASAYLEDKDNADYARGKAAALIEAAADIVCALELYGPAT